MYKRSVLISYRKELHAHPELSHKEENTAARILSFFEKYNATSVHRNIGGQSLAFVFDSKKPGPSILFRAELDALPIEEINSFEYVSKNPGVGHLCGHDGHIAILLGMAERLSENKPKSGKVILFFQSAEETGEGAKLAIEDPFFDTFQIDHAFALHNLPGFHTGQVIVRDRAFSSASVGMSIQLSGKTSHAGYPENGVNPGMATAEIILSFNSISLAKEFYGTGTFITLVQVALGEKAFGTSAGHSIIRATLRSADNESFRELIRQAEEAVYTHAEKEGLKAEISYHEEFFVVENDPASNGFVRNVSVKLGLEVIEPQSAFRWSEDFSWFTSKFNGCLFGVGAGIEHPQLHNPDYDFPDEIIASSVELFYGISTEIQHKYDSEKTNIHP
ncbi:MAG: amidohydrolase [Bacteroidales bacterium]|nr:amidohydrolase [Bacteroidales bacterium]MCF8458268.1 amidohydrolase [Bacteroidales bacterium]